MSIGNRKRVAATLWLSLASASPARAAVELPARNPRASVSQEVGLTQVAVDYASPAAGERGAPQLFTGAPLRGRDDPAARIAFSRDVVLWGTRVPAGRYALIIAPAGQAWTFVLYRDPDRVEASHAAPAELEQARLTVTAHAAERRERLTILFSDSSAERASLDFEWAGARASLPIVTDTRAAILSEIRALDDVGHRYASVARYFLESKKDLDAGLGFAKRAVALENTQDNRALEARLEAARAGNRRASPPVSPPPALREPAAPVEPKEKGSDTGAVASAPRGPAGSIALAASIAPVRLDERAPSAPRRATTPTEIGPVVRQNRADLEACYQRALRKDPELTRARITVSISIGTSGAVQKVGFDGASSTELGSVERCVRSAVSRWVFPPASAPYEAQIPLVLSATQ